MILGEGQASPEPGSRLKARVCVNHSGADSAGRPGKGGVRIQPSQVTPNTGQRLYGKSKLLRAYPSEEAAEGCVRARQGRPSRSSQACRAGKSLEPTLKEHVHVRHVCSWRYRDRTISTVIKNSP